MAQGRKVVPIGGMPVAQPQVRNVNLAAIPGVEVPMDADAVDNAALQFSKALGELAPSLGALWQRVEEAKKKGSGKRAALTIGALTRPGGGGFGFSQIQKLTREEAAAWFKAEKAEGRYLEIPYDPTARPDDWLNFKVLAGKRYLANAGLRDEFLHPDIIAQFSKPDIDANALEDFISGKIDEITEDMKGKESAPFLLGVLSSLQEGPNALIPTLRKRVEAQLTKNASIQFESDAVGATRELFGENFFRDYLNMKKMQSHFETDEFKALNIDQQNVQIEAHNLVVEDLDRQKMNLAFSMSELFGGPANIGRLTPMDVALQAARLEGLEIVDDDDDGDFRPFIEFLRDIPIFKLGEDGTPDPEAFDKALGDDHRFEHGIAAIVKELQAKKNLKNADKGISTPQLQGDLIGLLTEAADKNYEETKGLGRRGFIDWARENQAQIIEEAKKKGLSPGHLYATLDAAAQEVERNNRAALGQKPGQDAAVNNMMSRIQDGDGTAASLRAEIAEGGHEKFGREGTMKLREALDAPLNKLKLSDTYKDIRRTQGDKFAREADKNKFGASHWAALVGHRARMLAAFDEKLKSFKKDEEGTAEEKRERWLLEEANAWVDTHKGTVNDDLERLKKASVLTEPSQVVSSSSESGTDIREEISATIDLDYPDYASTEYDEDLEKPVVTKNSRGRHDKKVRQIIREVKRRISSFVHPDGKDGPVNARLSGLNDIQVREEITDWVLDDLLPDLIKEQLDPQVAPETIGAEDDRMRRLHSRFRPFPNDDDPRGKSAKSLSTKPENFGAIDIRGVEARGNGANYKGPIASQRVAVKILGEILMADPQDPHPDDSFALEFTRMLDNPGVPRAGYRLSAPYTTNSPADLHQQAAFLSLYLSDPERYEAIEEWFDIETEMEDWAVGASAWGRRIENRGTMTQHLGNILMWKGVSIEELTKDQIASGGISLQKLWVGKDRNRDIPWQFMPIGPHGKVNDTKEFIKWQEDAHKKVENKKTGEITTILMPTSEWSDDNPYKRLVTDVLQLSEDEIKAGGYEEGQTEVGLFWASQASVRLLRDRTMQHRAKAVEGLVRTAEANFPEDRSVLLQALDKGLHTFPNFTGRAPERTSPWMRHAIKNSQAFNK